MSESAVLLLIILLCFLSGWGLIRPFLPTLPLTKQEGVFAAIAVGSSLIGWLAFLLAEIGLFTITALAILLTLTLAVLTLMTRRRPKPVSPTPPLPPETPLFPWIPRQLEYPMLIIWLLGAGWLFLRPHEFIFGGADAGVYMNLAARIATHGSIQFHDPTLAELDATLRLAFLQPVTSSVVTHTFFPAFYVTQEAEAEITPQFFHLYPVWAAIGYGLAGSLSASLQAALQLNGLWALGGAWAFYLTVRRLTGWEVAYLALLGLSLNGIIIWFARYPITETLSFYLLWGSFWSLGVWLSHNREHPFLGFLAGVLFGESFLTRIDFLFVLPIVAFFMFLHWMTGWKRKDFWFWVPLWGLLAHALLHAVWQSRPYFFDLFDFAILLLMRSWWLPLTAVVIAGVVVGVLSRSRDQLARLAVYQRPFLFAIILVLLLLTVYSWWIRPLQDSGSRFDGFSQTTLTLTDNENLPRLGWYLSSVGIWLGVAGIAALIWHVDRRTAVLLAITLFFTLLYLWNIRANPHHIYAVRRYVPATVPLFILGAAYAIGQITRYKGKWGIVVAGVTALLWLGGIILSARGFVTQIDYKGIIPQLETLDSQFAPDSILLFNDQEVVGIGYFWGTPLRFILEHPVLVLRDPTQLDSTLLVKQLENWHNNGRSIYWIGDPTWLTQQKIAFTTSTATLSANYLENSYTHKPSAVIPVQWALQISHLWGQNED